MTLFTGKNTKDCRQCGNPFLPLMPLQAVCGPVCATKYAKGLGKERKVKAKAERESFKARKEKAKTRSDYIKEAQVAVNRYCRLRDLAMGHGCISCGAKPGQKFGGTMDAGHWRSVGSAPHLRFFTTQIRLQCVRCNRYLGGSAVEFRRGLVERIGVARVEEIEAMQGVAKWDVAYLQRLTKIMRKRARRLEKRNAMQG